MPVFVRAEPSRCTLGEAKFMSWAPRENPWTLKGGLLHLDAKPDAVAEFKFTRKNDARFITSFPSGPGWRVSFKYRSSANATLALRASPMDSFGGQDLRFQSKALPLSDGWTDFCWEPRTSQNDYYGSSLSLSCAKGNGFVEIRDFSITDIAPEDKTGKPLLVNGKKVREVCLYGSDTPMRRLNDLRAAFMFRYALRAAGGEWIPIREVATAKEAGANAVLVGRLAVDAGVVAAAEQAKVEGLTGGWAIAAKGARLGLAGAVPCGVQRGAWRTLERLGIVYLGSDMFKPFPGRAFETGTFSEAVVPATAFPLEAKNGRSGHNAELRGTVSRDCLVGTLAIGAVPDVEVVSEDSLGYVVPVSEFRDSHPEYFALQSDGTRLTDDAHAKNLSHFCWTAPGLPELIASRYVEMMRALPEQPVWLLAPGDGAAFNCKCENCKALGGDSDGLVRLANRVAELTSREFPGNIIQIYSYVDTPEPPKNPVRAHKNLNVGYCVYPSKYWPSGMVIPHPANEKGMNAMEGWRRECCPRLSLFGYFQQCPQWMHCWPGFDAAVWLTRNFSEHHSFLTWRWGLFPSHGNINECSSFTDLAIYVLSRLEVDPSQDERKLANRFIDWYYGVAAKPMRSLFEMAMAEPRRRDWVQTCEQRRKGLISRKFADAAFPLLDEAERLAGDDEALKRRIRKQVIQFYWTYLDGVNRVCGNVPSSDIDKWTGRVVRFVKACRDNGSYYFNWNGHKKWFHDNLMLDLTMPDMASDWTRAPEINRLLEDPKGVLAAKVPNMQQKTADGFAIPAEGMMGGEYKDGWKGRIVRRRSSGAATVITHLDLESLPTGKATMHLKGYDSDKEAVAEIAICVNEKVVYKGPVKLAKKKHSEWALELPDGLLKAGENEIIIINTTPDTEVDGEGGYFFRATRDYYWGWFMVNGLRFSFDSAKKP